VFNVSVLHRHTLGCTRQLPRDLQPTIVDDYAKWDVVWSLDAKRCYRLHCCSIQWVGLMYLWTSCEPEENLGNVDEMVDDIHQEYLRMHR
jgi:hypothetical protein